MRKTAQVLPGQIITVLPECSKLNRNYPVMMADCGLFYASMMELNLDYILRIFHRIIFRRLF